MNFFKAKPPPLRSVLFVCTANITRSAAAEVMFRDLATKSGHVWKVASAGVNAFKNSPPNSQIAFRLKHRGTPNYSHKSQPITQKLLKNYYWIIVMEVAHKEAILKMDPSLTERVFILREFGLEEPLSEPDMPDPTGKDSTEDNSELIEILEYEIPRFLKLVEIKIEDLFWVNKVNED